MILYRKVTDLLSKIELSGCDDSDLKELEVILRENIAKILERNGNPIFIINLLNQSDMFSTLFDSMKEKIPTNTLNIINIELGYHVESQIILQKNISNLRERFNSSTNGVYTRYADNPLGIIEYLIEKYPSDQLFEILNREFIPLIIDVFSSAVSLETKQEYLKTLIELLSEYKKSKRIVPKSLTIFFSEKEIKLEEDWSIEQSSRISSLYYVSTIKSLLDLDSENEILTSCINYKKNSRSERGSFSYSIQKFIEFSISSKKMIPSFINLIVMDMLQDNYFMVRKNAIKCLLLLYSESPSELFKNELIRMTADISPNFKFYYINQLSKNILDKDMTKSLLSLFLKDGSYAIKTESKNLLS